MDTQQRTKPPCAIKNAGSPFPFLAHLAHLAHPPPVRTSEGDYQAKSANSADFVKTFTMLHPHKSSTHAELQTPQDFLGNLRKMWLFIGGC